MTNKKIHARSAVGFSITNVEDPVSINKSMEACDRALAHLPWLNRRKIDHGCSHLEIWGHHDMEQSLYTDDQKNLYVLVGSPHNVLSWENVVKRISQQGEENFSLRWEGRCLLIRVSSDGKNWCIWNDWAGSIPVFHTQLQKGSIASVMEPIVVAGAQLTADHFSKRGIVELLIHGQFLGADSLYEGVQVLFADTCSVWKSRKFISSKKLWTIVPSEERWHKNWNDLTKEMYEHTVRIIKNIFVQYQKCILPLSGGMDSRLIAIVVKEMNIPVKSYTYGHEGWSETIYAQQIAETLGIPWQRIELGTDYLDKYTKCWFELYGSSLHAHGMYQISFLRQIEKEQGVIPDGWYGNNLAGGNHPSKILLSDTVSAWHGFYKGYGSMWPIKDLKKILTFDPTKYIEQMTEIIARQVESVKHWPYYHRMNAVDMWNRQQRFVSYQPLLYDLWKGNATPFMDTEYARFCFSLPTKALDIRLLQRKMLERFWPKLAAIPGTYEQVSFSNRYYFKAKEAAMKVLPWRFLVGVMRMLGKVSNTMDVDCVRSGQWNALYPLTPAFNGQGIFNEEELKKTIKGALNYSNGDYSKVSTLQSVAHACKGI